jgi:hypothetical protein
MITLPTLDWEDSPARVAGEGGGADRGRELDRAAGSGTTFHDPNRLTRPASPGMRAE